MGVPVTADPVEQRALDALAALVATHAGATGRERQLPHAVYGYFLNGGGNCYVVRVGGDRDGATSSGDSAAAKAAGAAGASGGAVTPIERPAPGPAQAIVGGYRFLAREAGQPQLTSGAGGKPGNGGKVGNSGKGDAERKSPGEISIEIGPREGESPPEDRFTINVKRGGEQVGSFQVTTKRGKENVTTVLREQSKLVIAEELPGTAGLATGTVVLREPEPGSRPATAGVPAAASAPVPAPTPSVPAEIAADDYVGDVSARTGFGGLEAIDDVTMVAVPDLISAYERGAVDLEIVKAVQLAMIAHCELMGDRVAIIDPPPRLTSSNGTGLSPQQAKDWRLNDAGYDSKYAALYYPWIKVFDPATGSNRFVLPSGHMAGVWARNDATRGVHKAPAKEVIRGAVALQTQLTKAEKELLTSAGCSTILRSRF